jgi:hypothetical protein
MTKPRILIIEDDILIAREKPEARLKGLRLPWSASAVIGGLQVTA